MKVRIYVSDVDLMQLFAYLRIIRRVQRCIHSFFVLKEHLVHILHNMAYTVV